MRAWLSHWYDVGWECRSHNERIPVRAWVAWWIVKITNVDPYKPQDPEYGNLLELLGNDIPYEEAGWCSYDRKESTGGKNFLDWEREIAEPRLQELGYEVLEWRTGERDSWGPLSRIVVTNRGSCLYG